MHMEEIKRIYRILDRNPEQKRQLRTSRHLGVDGRIILNEF